jgi:hypothetical protein
MATPRRPHPPASGRCRPSATPRLGWDTPLSPSLSWPSPTLWCHLVDRAPPPCTGIKWPRCRVHTPFYFPLLSTSASLALCEHSPRPCPFSPRLSVHFGPSEISRAAGFWPQRHRRPILPLSSARTAIVPRGSLTSQYPFLSSSYRTAGTLSPATRASLLLERCRVSATEPPHH